MTELRPVAQPQDALLTMPCTESAILRLCRQVMRQLDPAAGEAATLRAGLELAALVEAAGRVPDHEIPCAPGARVEQGTPGPASPTRAFASLSNSRPVEAIRRAAPFRR